MLIYNDSSLEGEFVGVEENISNRSICCQGRPSVNLCSLLFHAGRIDKGAICFCPLKTLAGQKNKSRRFSRSPAAREEVEDSPISPRFWNSSRVPSAVRMALFCQELFHKDAKKKAEFGFKGVNENSGPLWFPSLENLHTRLQLLCFSRKRREEKKYLLYHLPITLDLVDT